MVKQLRCWIQRSCADVISSLDFLETLLRKSLAELVNKDNTDIMGRRSVNEPTVHWPATWTNACEAALTCQGWRTFTTDSTQFLHLPEFTIWRSSQLSSVLTAHLQFSAVSNGTYQVIIWSMPKYVHYAWNRTIILSPRINNDVHGIIFNSN